MGILSNWFSPGSSENYDEESSRQDYFEQRDAEDDDLEESKTSQVAETSICAKCGGSGCAQCDGTGRV